MISTTRKIPLLRYALIVSLIIVLFCSSFYFYVYYSKIARSRLNSGQVVLARENAARIDSCLIYLYSADNNSRLYALTGENKYFQQFDNQIKYVDQVVDQLNVNHQNKQISYPQKKITELIDQKTSTLENYVALKLLSDSLLKSAAHINEAVEGKRNHLAAVPVIRKITSHIKVDTIKPAAAPYKRKRLFGRIIDAFSSKKSVENSNKKAEDQQLPVVVQKRTDVITETRVVRPKVNDVYAKNYKKLLDANNELKHTEQQLLGINKHLIEQIIGSLKKYKVTEQSHFNKEKLRLRTGHQESVFKLKKLSGFILFFFASLIIVILYNIWKIFRNQKDLITYGNRAERYALSKSAFLASMSHEIRTPLNSVIGFSEQLSQGELNESQQEQVNAISSSSKMLLDVVNEILDFSKFETGKMSFDLQPFNPYQVIEEIFKSVSIQAEVKGIELINEMTLKQDYCLNGDSFRLKQVILNFLSNAIKFTEKGKVVLKAGVDEKNDGTVILHVSVKDNGVGIAKENIPLIFGEFSQIASAQEKASQKGTGLGLAISKKIVEQQGGSILVTSELEKGSEFSFQLPFAVLESSECDKNDAVDIEVIHQHLKGKHVLIAEDNQLSALLLTTILKKWGITSNTANNGEEAFKLFGVNTYDMLLTDIEMPEMNGMELSLAIRKHADQTKKNIPILALTANVLQEDKERYIKAGMNGVVLKPFTERNLLDNMASVLNTKDLLKGFHI